MHVLGNGRDILTRMAHCHQLKRIQENLRKGLARKRHHHDKEVLVLVENVGQEHRTCVLGNGILKRMAHQC